MQSIDGEQFQSCFPSSIDHNSFQFSFTIPPKSKNPKIHL
ncbi:hypothetical protein LEP1GSC202_1553 [Leptospira yanagawae serovar Saopaulo str. Sao Paulo = ATCC 700523]|uniref:Uncharacterized protein n=1 Tax=Leptospira yanagawae serovar Saopaulo str. Sao Paulo = ATCC 700523 TaxID=1249483 RepID=A0A5E8HG27_9LEPT|nr:hypothetical protein LEP1GSC202_1553 [Leptospira yanagawae serovar Saopaulo str. Sao Paulo = ATCC 700523]